MGLALPHAGLPSLTDPGLALALLVVPQIPLTLANSVVAASIPLPSVQKAVMGAVFPAGLIAIIVGGAELFNLGAVSMA